MKAFFYPNILSNVENVRFLARLLTSLLDRELKHSKTSTVLSYRILHFLPSLVSSAFIQLQGPRIVDATQRTFISICNSWSTEAMNCVQILLCQLKVTGEGKHLPRRLNHEICTFSRGVLKQYNIKTQHIAIRLLFSLTLSPTWITLRQYCAVESVMAKLISLLIIYL